MKSKIPFWKIQKKSEKNPWNFKKRLDKLNKICFNDNGYQIRGKMMRIRQSKYQDMIYGILQGVNVHMSAEEVFQKAKAMDDSIGIATVYRQLNALAEKKLIQRIRDKEQGYIYDGNGTPHHHFHCLVCGTYSDIDMKYDTQLNQMVEEETGALVQSHQLIFEGICKHCKTKM